MVRYACLVNQRLGSFTASEFEHIPRDLNQKAVVTASISIKETVFLPIYYQPTSSITTDRVIQIDKEFSSWLTLTMHYLGSGELPGNIIKARKI